jgi:hypothetical protein
MIGRILSFLYDAEGYIETRYYIIKQIMQKRIGVI